jgi:hypothetical protein
MNDELYNKTMDLLRQVKPEPASANKLTDHILEKIDSLSKKQQRYISLRVNEKQWTVYRVVRLLTTAAAMFLIGFFIIQQWEIKQKLSRLENGLVISHPFDTDARYPGRNERIQKVIYELQQNPVANADESQQKDVLQINRKSLNYLLEKIRELEKENTSYRKKLSNFYSDTTLIKP